MSYMDVNVVCVIFECSGKITTLNKCGHADVFFARSIQSIPNRVLKCRLYDFLAVLCGQLH